MHGLAISEVFNSIQGEGVLQGLPMTFIRLQGCPYRCTWCDSKYTWPFDWSKQTPIKELVEQARDFNNKWVSVTGGEPLAQKLVWSLFKALHVENFWITCETSGALLIDPNSPVRNWVVDMKCPASGMCPENDLRNLTLARSQDQIKFVIQDRADLDWALSLLEQYRHLWPGPRILFSPVQGVLPADMLVSWLLTERDCLTRARINENWQLSLQQHKVIWPYADRGV